MYALSDLINQYLMDELLINIVYIAASSQTSGCREGLETVQ